MEKNILKRVASLALAVVMMLSVIVIMPEAANAADLGKTVTASKKQTVTISDEQCYGIHEAGVEYGSGQNYWIKFKAKKDGYVTVKASNASNLTSYTVGTWALYNSSKKKQLSPAMDFDTNQTDSYYYTDYYGIKKGTTYNLCVQALAGTKVTLTFKDVKEVGGSKKSKAKSLSKGKEITGLLVAGSTSSDWYKVNIASTSLLKLDVTPYIGGKLHIEVKGPGIYDTAKDISYTLNGKKYQMRWSGKVRKGTYYIQVKPTTKTSTGAYKLKWVK